jgi:sigma-E factor negative regulatory protein RseA
MMSEYISALADGEIDQDENAALIVSVLQNKKSMQAWRDYQLIGDVMRNDQLLSVDFTQNFMQKLEQEPTVLSPNAITRQSTQESRVAMPEVSARVEKMAGNMHPRNMSHSERLPVFWSVAASCAAVMVVGWVLLNQQIKEEKTVSGMTVAQNTQAVQPAVASVNVNSTTATTPQEYIAIPQEYLAAHQHSAPSVSSYYIQTASYSE